MFGRATITLGIGPHSVMVWIGLRMIEGSSRRSDTSMSEKMCLKAACVGR